MTKIFCVKKDKFWILGTNADRPRTVSDAAAFESDGCATSISHTDEDHADTPAETDHNEYTRILIACQEGLVSAISSKNRNVYALLGEPIDADALVDLMSRLDKQVAKISQTPSIAVDLLRDEEELVSLLDRIMQLLRTNEKTMTVQDEISLPAKLKE